MEGGKKVIEAGQLVGVVRALNLDPDNTVYTLHHSYNKDGNSHKDTSLLFSSFSSNDPLLF